MNPIALVVTWWWALLGPVCWAPPVPGPVAEPYRAPACHYCAGHRGITFAPPDRSPVQSVEEGSVEFAGDVAGVRWVVVRHTDGLRASYGRLRVVIVRPGQHVRAGQVLGRSSARLYFGLRAGDTSVDPTSRFGRWRARTRLVPLDDGPRRPAGPVQLACAASPASR
jgi:murein DD-endopeptidase MepM/ murein hydrolase activator NlpD